MIKNNHGHIVALSSCAGLFGVNNLVPYCGTKFAVRGIMETLHIELHSQNRNNNIKVTAIYPYMVDTGLCKKPVIRFKKYMPMQTPKEVAEVLVASQRRGLEEVSIPKHFLYINTYMRYLF